MRFVCATASLRFRRTRARGGGPKTAGITGRGRGRPRASVPIPRRKWMLAYADVVAYSARFGGPRVRYLRFGPALPRFAVLPCLIMDGWVPVFKHGGKQSLCRAAPFRLTCGPGRYDDCRVPWRKASRMPGTGTGGCARDSVCERRLLSGFTDPDFRVVVVTRKKRV